MKLQILLGVVSSLALAGGLLTTLTSDATNCTGPTVTFTSVSSCGSPTIALSQGLINNPFPRTLRVERLSSEEPNARGRGRNAAGTLRCSTKDETLNDGPGPLAGCNTDVATNQASAD